jgi:hypothetical protein
MASSVGAVRYGRDAVTSWGMVTEEAPRVVRSLLCGESATRCRSSRASPRPIDFGSGRRSLGRPPRLYPAAEVPKRF